MKKECNHMKKECNHICECRCHIPNVRIMHFINCCIKCDKCDENIKRVMTDIHHAECHFEFNL
jgi:hypothetical protein